MLFPRHIGVWAVLLACLVGSPAFGHDQESHQAALPSGAAAGVPLPFPVDIGGPFELTDQDRRTRRDSDFHGGYAMIFFGYATCKGICPVGMRRMVEAIDLLGEPWRTLSLMNPILYMVNAFRYGILGTSDIGIGTAYAILAVFVVVLFATCQELMRRGVGIRE